MKSAVGFVVAVVVVALVWLFTRKSEKRLHQEQSAFQKLSVVEADGRRCLQFGDGALNQSCISTATPHRLELNYARAVMAVILSWQPEPKRVLVIGMGGGSLTMALAKERPNTHSDSVELDPAVIRLAEKFFGFSPTPTMRAFAGDGASFVKDAASRGAHYDVVVLDAFDDSNIPTSLLTVEFLSGVQQLLGPTGSLIVNTIPRGAAATHESDSIRAVFGHLGEIDVVRNRLLVSGPRPLPLVTELLATTGPTLDALQRLGADRPWIEALRIRP